MRPIRQLIDEYEWVHTGIGLLGNVLFVTGSALFLGGASTTVSGTAFIAGSILMLVGALGQVILKLEEHRRQKHHNGRRTAALSGS